MATHPNAAGALVLGLGCENNTVESFKGLLGSDGGRLRFLVAQDFEDEVEEGVRLVGELVSHAETFVREPLDIGLLVVGLKCGGSDAFSGITANPLVGRISDRLVAHGGTALLTEVPEMFGAEELLMGRCPDSKLFEETVELVNGFKEYFIRHNQEVYENPSPGNKAGGITTLEEKSLGCTQKGGESAVRGVLSYGERVFARGLNLLQGPGNDIVAITALMASGAQLALFTTGRGTPVGAPIPTLKISSNSELAQKKPKWIDFDAGRLLTGETFDEAEDLLWRLLIDVAEGKRTRNEENGVREIAIFKDGITL
jgi:altronate hydrolase